MGVLYFLVDWKHSSVTINNGLKDSLFEPLIGEWRKAKMTKNEIIIETVLRVLVLFNNFTCAYFPVTLIKKTRVVFYCICIVLVWIFGRFVLVKIRINFPMITRTSSTTINH